MFNWNSPYLIAFTAYLNVPKLHVTYKKCDALFNRLKVFSVRIFLARNIKCFNKTEGN